MCVFVQWGDVDGGAVSVMAAMCFQLFSVLCLYRCSCCSLCLKWVLMCVV